MTQSNKYWRYGTLSFGSVIIFLSVTLIVAIAFEFFNWEKYGNITLLLTTLPSSYPTYAIYGKSRTEDHLTHVVDVLQRLGYRRVSIDHEWDLLWAHDYPFLQPQLSQRLKNLLQYQIVNHIPGCGFLTNKVDLSTSVLPFLPRSFRLPLHHKEFLLYAQNHPDSIFVEKHNEHRQIFIRSPREVNLISSDSFVQEFVPNPFLVDGYKFDIGVYVLLTSVNPLRVYIYQGDMLFRYCSVKYQPFNSSDIDKYVVGNDYLPTWDIPSLVKYYTIYGGSMRNAFDSYVRDQSLDPKIIWLQVEDIIRTTILSKEEDIVRILGTYKTKNFFDLMRFDLIVDDQLHVYLMEANMSPNLSSAHFKLNSLLYEQILYSVFNLVGIGSSLKLSSAKHRFPDIEEMVTSEKNLATNLNSCSQYNCENSCDLEECSLCLSCLSGSDYEHLRKAHREHIHRTDMRRIFPTPIYNRKNLDINATVKNMTQKNSWMTRWFYEKCKYDNSWCC